VTASSSKMSAMTNLALFDLDHTLIPIDSDHEWGRFMIKHGMVDKASFTRDNERFYGDYKAGRLDIDAYLLVALAPLARHPRAELDAWRQRFMQDVILPAILPAARDLVRGHKENGDLCCMITATNSFVTWPIAHAFGMDHMIACEPATVDNDPAGNFTGEATGIPSFREGKIVRTEAWLASQGKSWSDFDRSFFYSDSLNDIPLLEKVSNPVATNPDDTLRAHAQSRSWRILELFRPK
jgi:HAD superfamily hydrolase (TIGR01490 family)